MYVYKNIQSEIFDCVENMSKNSIDEVNFTMENQLVGDVVFEIKLRNIYNNMNIYEVKKYNKFGNQFSYTLCVNNESHKVDIGDMNIKPIHTFTYNKFMNVFKDNQNHLIHSSKFGMCLEKHNLNIDDISYFLKDYYTLKSPF